MCVPFSKLYTYWYPLNCMGLSKWCTDRERKKDKVQNPFILSLKPKPLPLYSSHIQLRKREVEWVSEEGKGLKREIEKLRGFVINFRELVFWPLQTLLSMCVCVCPSLYIKSSMCILPFHTYILLLRNPPPNSCLQYHSTPPPFPYNQSRWNFIYLSVYPSTMQFSFLANYQKIYF